eukprot:21261-Alexandrium_andersonii.AAC.1
MPPRSARGPSRNPCRARESASNAEAGPARLLAPRAPQRKRAIRQCPSHRASLALRRRTAFSSSPTPRVQ